MWRLIISVAVILAGCGQAKPAKPPEAALPKQETVSELLKHLAALDEACHGNGDDPKTLEACDKREPIAQKLHAAGWCFGPIDLPMYQQKWAPCADQGKKSALATVVANAPPQAAQDVVEAEHAEADNDTVHFDPSEANLRIQMSTLETSIYGCMSKATELYLRQGVTSRKELRSLAMFRCTSNARPFMTSKGIPKDEQDRFLDGLAEEATSNTIVELGGR